MPLEKQPTKWPTLVVIVATTAVAVLWVYAGTRTRPGQSTSPAADAREVTPTTALAKGLSREACDKLRRDMKTNSVEFDADNPSDVAVVMAWDAACRSSHGIAIFK